MFTVNFIFYSKHLFIFGHFVGVDSGQPCSWLDGNWRHRRHLLAPGPQEACNVLYLNNLFFLLAWRYVLVSLRNSLSQLILPQVCCQSHRRPLLGDVVRSWCNKCHPCQRWSQQSFAYIYSLLAKRWLFWRGFKSEASEVTQLHVSLLTFQGYLYGNLIFFSWEDVFVLGVHF